MNRTSDESVPIGSDWETSKRNFEQSRQPTKSIEIEQARSISQVNYGIIEDSFNQNNGMKVSHGKKQHVIIKII